jgi:hypothetical protein
MRDWLFADSFPKHIIRTDALSFHGVFGVCNCAKL